VLEVLEVVVCLKYASPGGPGLFCRRLQDVKPSGNLPEGQPFQIYFKSICPPNGIETGQAFQH